MYEMKWNIKAPPSNIKFVCVNKSGTAYCGNDLVLDEGEWNMPLIWTISVVS